MSTNYTILLFHITREAVAKAFPNFNFSELNFLTFLTFRFLPMINF